MKDGFIKVAAATPEIKVADCAFNASSVISLIAEAEAKGAAVIVFPELCLTGGTAGDLFFTDALLSGAEEALLRIIKATKKSSSIVFVGLPIMRDGLIYDCAAVVSGGSLLGIVPKSALSGSGDFSERRVFAAAPERNLEAVLCGFTVPFGARLLFAADNLPELRIAACFWSELIAARSVADEKAAEGALILACLSASAEEVGKADFRRGMLTHKSAELVAGLVLASAGEGESTTDMIFAGHNIVSENGKILSESKLFETGLILSEIDVKYLLFKRSHGFCTGSDEGYETIRFRTEVRDTELTREFEKLPFVPSPEDKLSECAQLILDMQARALKKRMDHASSAAAVVGVSGGLDSCLVLLACARAFKMMRRPLTDIIAVSMPCFGTTKRTKSNAQRLSELLGVSFRTVDITRSVKAHLKDIGHDGVTADVTFENSQARERTQVLMDIANTVGGIVVGTGDLSELALGWATYNGDHMSMYGVNGSVPKTLIRRIVKCEAEQTEDKKLSAVLYDILDTPVSPELLPSSGGDIAQKTEDLVGPYELHDFFLYHFIIGGFGAGKIYRVACRAFDGMYDCKTVEKWLRIFFRRFFAQQFKRSCMPDGVKICPVSLSPRGGWSMPSDACRTLWEADLDGRL